jgi:hypothetical protein
VVAVSRAELNALAKAGFNSTAGGGSLLFASRVDPQGLGRAGEKAVPGEQNYERIPSDSGSASYRVPDRLTQLSIEEIKNRLKLSNTAQLRDYFEYANQTGRTFKLWLRGGANGPQTKLSSELLDLLKTGKIQVEAIPGTGSWVVPP